MAPRIRLCIEDTLIQTTVQFAKRFPNNVFNLLFGFNGKIQSKGFDAVYVLNLIQKIQRLSVQDRRRAIFMGNDRERSVLIFQFITLRFTNAA